MSSDFNAKTVDKVSLEGTDGTGETLLIPEISLSASEHFSSQTELLKQHRFHLQHFDFLNLNLYMSIMDRIGAKLKPYTTSV